jgi:hypothetical protein
MPESIIEENENGNNDPMSKLRRQGLAIQQYKNYLKFVDWTTKTIEIEGARSIDDPVQDEVPFVQQVLVFGL